MADYHTCPFPGCVAPIPYHQLACRSHWFQLPKDLRDRINHTWRAKNYDGHRVAMAEALDFYHGAQHQGGVERDAR